MWLQHKIYGFAQLDGSKVTTKKLLSSTLLIDDKPTEISLLRLFKSEPTEKESSVKGWSILEYLNQNGDIEIDGKIYNIKFVDDGGNVFRLIGMKNPDWILKDKDYTYAEMEEVSNLIKEASKVEETVPVEEPVSIAATAESPQAEETTAATAVEEVPAEVGTKVYSNEDFDDERKELKLTGYREFHSDEHPNHYLFIRGTRKIFAEVTESDYETLNVNDYLFSIDEEKKEFSFEAIKEEV